MATRRSVWPLLGQTSGSWPLTAIALAGRVQQDGGLCVPGAATVRGLPLCVEQRPENGLVNWARPCQGGGCGLPPPTTVIADP